MAVTFAPSDFPNPRSADAWNQRMLAAIVLTDGVGFGKRMAEDEVLALRVIDRDLKFMSSLCEQHSGQVIKSTGDGLLMMFPSAVNAVYCTLTIQRQMAAQATSLPPEETMQHRIGIHLGEVFYNGSDIMGNAVNIAARLEPKSPAGGLCFSQAVYDLVRDKLAMEVSSLGEQLLKNIRDPMMVYQITCEQLLDSEFATVVVPSQTSIRLGSAQRRSSAQRTERSSKLSQAERDRQVILSKVRNFWVQGVLENSLHGRAMLELGLEERPDAVQNPWGLAWETTEQTRQPLRPGTTATEMFDKLGTGATLLILGAPGSGKTTTLLQLTRDLLNRADHDPNHAIPIVFNLSSWQRGQSLTTWLVEELNSKYQVPKKLGKPWVENQELTLMLDGLDEVAENRRDACVDAINQFSQTHGHTEMVVCSRSKDYDALAKQLRFQGAIVVQALTDDQVNQYLTQAGDSLEGVREVVATDPQYKELVQSPLILSIMSIAYQGIPATDLIRLSLEGDAIAPLFNTYIDRALQRRIGKQPYSPAIIRHWLSWLARQMVQESQTVFLIERLQPTWLRRNQRWIYTLSFAVIWFSLLLPSPYITSIIIFSDNVWLIFSDITVLSLLLFYGLLFGLLWSIATLTVGDLTTKLMIGTAVVILATFGFMVIISRVSSGMGGWLSLTYGTLAWLMSTFTSLQIQPVETLKWSWHHAKQACCLGLKQGLIVGLLVGSLMGFLTARTPPWSFTLLSMSNLLAAIPLMLFYACFFGVLFELIGGLLGGFIGGLTGTTLESTTQPNQGIWQSLLAFVILGTGVAGLLGCLLLVIGLPMVKTVTTATILGIITGLFVAGQTVIKHIILRLLLWRGRQAPWNYARFLNYAASCILLQRVGGGYVFIHRLLLEHFAKADLEERTKQS